MRKLKTKKARKRKISRRKSLLLMALALGSSMLGFARSFVLTMIVGAAASVLTRRFSKGGEARHHACEVARNIGILHFIEAPPL